MFLQSFKGYEQCTVTDPVGGIFALFIICFLYKLLLNGKQMQTHQVCEQMVLLYDEEKMRVRGTASLEKMAFSPAPPPLSAGFLLALLLLASALSSAPPTFVRMKDVTG